MYRIYMGQALVLQDLVNNSIYTGPPPPGDALQSCSAVVMTNPGANCGGMYHYPSGAFTNNLNAQLIIANMAALVMPTEVYLYYGNAPGLGDTGAYDLSTHLLTYANHVSNRKATSGALHVQIVLGATAFNTAHQGGGVSLALQAAGPFPVAGVINGGTLFM